MRSKRVGVLMGGLSVEREVSLASGHAIESALRERGWPTVSIFVDQDVDQVLRQEPIDVAFIALHGSWGEDGCIQGLLEVMGIPYTGASVTASALAMDKLKAKELFRLHNVPTPPYYAIGAARIDDVEEIHGSFGYPVFVKPRRQGSSIGAGRADSPGGLKERCRDAARFDASILVERHIVGRELSVGVLDGEALGAIEIVPASGVYDYRSKYHKGSTEYHFPARLAPTAYDGVLRIAERAVLALGVEGACRVDLILSEGENEYVLEVNTLPGMTETSLLPKIAQGAGYDFGDLCEAILARAALHVGRGRDRSAPGLADAERSADTIASAAE